jgi:uroporphyrinogen decarboxylase
MVGLERVRAAIKGNFSDQRAVLPILHSGLPPLFGYSLGEYYTSAECMAEVIIKGYKTFGYDGVQLSLGVTGEAQALGADIEQPPDSGPVLRKRVLSNAFDEQTDVTKALNKLQQIDPSRHGRMPLYYDAVSRTVDSIGTEAFVLSLLRGPLLTASQLCGIESLLIAMIECPDRVHAVLDFTTHLAINLAGWLGNCGAHGLMFGEATCSPNFISPRMYRTFVQPRHQKLVSACRKKGWDVIGLHICGDITSIFSDMVDTGVNIIDIDYQLPAEKALMFAQNQVALRGNLDPSSVFRFGTEKTVDSATSVLIKTINPHPNWILSSGCDIPPGTPKQNIHAFMTAAHRI